MIRATLCLAALPILAQGPPPKPAAAPTGQASSNPLKELVRADLASAQVGTPEALVNTLYTFISGPKDQKRELEKIRALFHLQARVVVAARHPEKGPFLRPMDLEAFLGFAVPQWERTGFFEQGTGTRVQAFEGMAQVWSPYEIRMAADGPVVFTGVNAVQCAFDGKRWWIMHLVFQSVAAPAPAAPPAPAPAPTAAAPAPAQAPR